MSKNRILEMEIDFNENNFVIDNREGTKKNCQKFLEPSQESFYDSFETDLDYRSLITHDTSSGICKD